MFVAAVGAAGGVLVLGWAIVKYWRKRKAATAAAHARSVEAEARVAALTKVGLTSDLMRVYEKGERCSF